MAFGRGYSALNIQITRKRVLDFNKLAKVSVEALNKAGEEIAHRVKDYAEQGAPVYTGNLKSTIRVKEEGVATSLSPGNKIWSVVAGGKKGEGVHPKSRRPIRKYVDYAEYQERYGRKSGYMSNALNNHKEEYMMILKKYINGKLLTSQSNGGIFFKGTKK